jgi:AcrR family transcriptional regulator
VGSRARGRPIAPRQAKIRPGEPGLERIESAALELFGERGFDGTSIAEIGERAGITKSVLYHYFRSKADLYDAVCTRQTEALVEAVRSAVTDSPGEGALRPGINAYLDFLAANPAAWRLLLRDRPAEAAVASLHQRLEQRRAEALAALLASPSKRISKARHLGLLAVAVRAFAAWWYDNRDVPREDIADAIVAFARAGAEAAQA